MSTVSFSSSATLCSSEHERHEERSSSKSSQGSIDMESESESTMSWDDECAVDKIAESFAVDKIAESFAVRAGGPKKQVQVWEDPTILSDISWTDEKHSLYLNSIEEDFIKRLYERGPYIYSCKRQEAECITSSVSSKGLYEVTKAQMRYNSEEIQNSTKRSRLERICIKQGDKEGRVNNCKSFKQPAGEGSNEYTRKIQIKCFKDTYNKHDHMHFLHKYIGKLHEISIVTRLSISHVLFSGGSIRGEYLSERLVGSCIIFLSMVVLSPKNPFKLAAG